MQSDSGFFSLSYATNMNVAVFNKTAAKYGVHIDETDAPIDRLVKHSVFLSRRDNDGSHVPTNEEYVDMLLEVAACKADEPFASFYKALKAKQCDVTNDILEFHGKVSEGPNKGKYEVKLLRFDEDGKLQPMDEILVAPDGWAVALGAKHKFPVETSKNPCRTQNIEVPGLEDPDVSGYWAIGGEPNESEQRIDIRGPSWDDDRLLSANVNEGRSYSKPQLGCFLGGGNENVGALSSFASRDNHENLQQSLWQDMRNGQPEACFQEGEERQRQSS